MYEYILPQKTFSANIISIDPGSNHCGISVLNVTYDDRVTVLYSTTIHTGVCGHGSSVEINYGYTFTKFNYICNELMLLLIRYNPVMVISENAYMSKFAQAFAILSQLIMSLKITVYLYNSNISFHLIDPSTVKKHINVKGTSGDKNLTRVALTNLNLKYDNISINGLDEHAVDSLSVGLYGCYILNNVFNLDG